MSSKLYDLLFLIGLFLTLIGVIVLGTFFMGPSDVVQGIRVNLLGGSVMTFVGAVMIVGSFYNKDKM
ncbi:MAG TPA: hypothetical protein VNJ01_00180 [Bacteriovoracaceae bacterium]|nr:hypothetical protein [Bacteriovoracaceae bacterium]